MSDEAAADESARALAIDPRASFIVQAPAGSGKTSLLAQRFLRLLAEVERPEEIVAITFTRKAAAEMRHRIVTALAAAGTDAPESGSAHERHTFTLARAALANARRRGWDLERHPSRLHIQTIDGLNHWLSRRLPLAARLGISPELLDDARPVYAAAARRFVARLEDDDPLAAPLAQLVRLLDHDAAHLQSLVADMLASREMWLPKVLELAALPEPRLEMERLLAAAVRAELHRIRAAVDTALMSAILDLLGEARDAGEADGPLSTLGVPRQLPPATPEAIAEWRVLAQLLLTQKGEARRDVNKNHGFPPALKALKARMKALLEQLADAPGMVDALVAVGGLPPPGYSDEQWLRVDALLHALVPAAAELQAVFAERGQLDHAAVAAAARSALGAADAPSELALALEYRIRHLLVDEYQDTSPVQERLLERLVAGWQPDDGHTLFCVGDPMQSIYGFREADVTLFLEAQARGIGGVALTPVRLSRNFRSLPAIVDWVNRVFGQLLPASEDYERGAVRYSPCTHTRADEPATGAQVHAGIGRDPKRDAVTVADLVEQALATGDGTSSSVAILVRSRGVLPPIIAELRRRGIEYRGVELESLGERRAVRDLLALARALLHLGDRTAWLAVLRAPWCGLSLADLHALAADDRRATIWSRLGDPAVLARLSGDGQARVARIRPRLAQAMADRGRSAPGSWVRSAWLALDGPATVADASDLDNAEACFTALDALGIEVRGTPGAAAVEAAVEGLLASPVGNPDARVQLMTIHRAKGLEFDTVILPGLERRAPASDRRLLYWAPVAVDPGVRGIVLASHGDGGEARDADELESWMKRIERERGRYELGRVAYVAATRARRTLHLVGAAGVAWKDGEAELRPPPDDSLLGFLWPIVEQDFQRAFVQARAAGALPAADAATRPRRHAPPLARLPADFATPTAPSAARALPARRGQTPEAMVRPQFDWAGEEAVAVGTVVHGELERLARAGLPAARLERRPDAWAAELTRLGLPAASVVQAVARVEQAIGTMSGSAIAARLLDPAARDAASELSLTAWLDGEFTSVRIDRSFVDAEGVRWIVDWKTGAHEGGSRDEFLAHELERYAAQLRRYARIMHLVDARPQRVGLYFPLLDAWQEWRGD